MRAPLPNDLVLHILKDHKDGDQQSTHIVGHSFIGSPAKTVDTEPPSPGLWGGIPQYYRIELRDYVPFEPSIPLGILLQDFDVEIRTEIESAGPRYYPFTVNAGILRLNQGQYLTRCTPLLFQHIKTLFEIDSAPVETRDTSQDDSSVYEFGEGRRMSAERQFFARNPALVAAAKKKHGFLCQICKFDFGRAYGPLGEGYIEAHHLSPLSERDPSTWTDKLRRPNAFRQSHAQPNKACFDATPRRHGPLCRRPVVGSYESLCSRKFLDIKNHHTRPLSEVRVTRFALSLFQQILEFKKSAKIDNARSPKRSRLSLIPELSLKTENEFDSIRPTSGTTPKGVWQTMSNKRDQSRLDFLIPPELAADFESELKIKMKAHLTDEATEGVRIKRLAVKGQSLGLETLDLVKVVVGLGGGLGIASILKQIAAMVVNFGHIKRGEVKLQDKNGVVVSLKGDRRLWANPRWCMFHMRSYLKHTSKSRNGC
jgi:hypothetical protein